ncbi:OsmC family protein [Roseiconus nitratireducens]|uniref:OsmC family protein n=1 Tax=Roseiconus nitratireducens TaxID=2605748 RepID=A0A5M6CW32_9BACT|nr:OsmC family protein [Roseiconus nitratireducens]KAA5539434.1 OsmC family protein [Roseiconus nitratireducens]
MESKAAAVWNGSLKDGKGELKTDSSVLRGAPYSFKSRFEGGDGTTPEELIAAAHAGCFSMALSMILGESELTAKQIETEATVTLEKKDGGFAITRVHLDVNAIVPGAQPEAFEQAASTAKENCPVSKLLNAEISMTARLTDIG